MIATVSWTANEISCFNEVEMILFARHRFSKRKKNASNRSPETVVCTMQGRMLDLYPIYYELSWVYSLFKRSYHRKWSHLLTLPLLTMKIDHKKGERTSGHNTSDTWSYWMWSSRINYSVHINCSRPWPMKFWFYRKS